MSIMPHLDASHSRYRVKEQNELERNKQLDFLQQCVLLYSIKNSQITEKLTLTKQLLTPKSSSSNQSEQIANKIHKIPFFFCLEGAPDLPKYLCPLYRTTKTITHPSPNIVLYIHLLVQSSINISMECKNSIIEKYTKLQEFLKAYKSLSNEVLLKTF